MKVLSTGQLGTAVAGSGVTGLTWGSGTSTPPIDLSGMGLQNRVGVWLSLEGNPGVSGASLTAIWKGCYSKGGVTYSTYKNPTMSEVTGAYLIKSAKVTGNSTFVPSSVSGGCFLKQIVPVMPWGRIEAIVSRCGTTNAMILRYAVCAF